MLRQTWVRTVKAPLGAGWARSGSVAQTRRWGSIRARALLATFAAILAVPGGASAYAPHPVSFHLADGATAAARHPNASPPGANDWSCKPTAAHPRPVVLVHGLLGTKTSNWDTMAPLLADNGFCVFALTYGRDARQPLAAGLGSMRDGARELAAFVDRVLAATGSAKVDLVGHSEGTVMPRYWTNVLGGASKVGRYVMFTPIWHGTLFFGVSLVQQLAAAYLPPLAGAARALPPGGVGLSGPVARACTPAWATGRRASRARPAVRRRSTPRRAAPARPASCGS